MVTPTISASPPAASPAKVEYPESDGQPMAESDVHYRCLVDVRFMLEHFFAAEPDVYVSGNLLLYYEEGEPRRSVAPDVFVVRGVPKRQRPSYKLWEEGPVPQFVLEISSRSTRGEDLGAKRGLYEWLGVREYFLFDPLNEYLRPPLQGFALVENRYEPFSRTADGSLISTTLGLELRLRANSLRLYDPAAARWLPTPDEETAARQVAEARLAAAEGELARLRRSRRRVE